MARKTVDLSTLRISWPFQNIYLFVIVDATSKCKEVFQVNSKTAHIIIQKFSETMHDLASKNN